ncbi:hypothetical protein EVAR_51527_1 [Eumeta japonica]|uniref:Secreted protein n=1 Tax=Eumeta variegata TaxID=151549 RepID=A0A4C1XEU6_EUMVA|nr:hypothetical protein EVAR_51527_1 [Eumeta japonica]
MEAANCCRVLLGLLLLDIRSCNWRRSAACTVRSAWSGSLMRTALIAFLSDVHRHLTGGGRSVACAAWSAWSRMLTRVAGRRCAAGDVRGWVCVRSFTLTDCHFGVPDARHTPTCRGAHAGRYVERTPHHEIDGTSVDDGAAILSSDLLPHGSLMTDADPREATASASSRPLLVFTKLPRRAPAGAA